MLLNIGKVIVGLQDSLRAFNMANRASLEVIDCNFADALRLIEDLQSAQLRLVDEYSFSAKLCTEHLSMCLHSFADEWIPVEVGRIKQFAINEMKTWLGQIREYSPQIGRAAMTAAQRRLEMIQSGQGEEGMGMAQGIF